MTISDIIKAYKADFKRVDDEERYKWVAIGCYKKHWDIDAPDFAGMFQRAYAEQGNLLTSQRSYSYSMVVRFAGNHPEEVRNLFRLLFDRSLPLKDRYAGFRKGFDAFVKEVRSDEPDRNKNPSHFQDLHAVSVYLAFEYPEEYTMYREKVFKGFSKLIGFTEERESGKYEVWKLENTNRLCDEIMTAIKADPDVSRMSHDRLTEDCYADQNDRLLAQDIMLYGSKNAEQLEKAYERPTQETDDRPTREKQMTDISKNTILYGPPGTGKTYSTVIYTVAAIEKKTVKSVQSETYDSVLARFNNYKSKGFIATTTFHQSYGYEEFVEGIKPVMDDDADISVDVRYQITSGIFKEFCAAAEKRQLSVSRDFSVASDARVWCLCLGGRDDNPHKKDCFENNYISIGWSDLPEIISPDYDAVSKSSLRMLLNFQDDMKIGDLVVSQASSSSIDGIGIITGDYQIDKEAGGESFRKRSVKWLSTGKNYNITEINGGTQINVRYVYELRRITAAQILSLIGESDYDTQQTNTKPYVFIIDEINRGNISKIFGELITLIEPTKRIGQPEGMTVRLPYSKQHFGVPDNVYLLGTMNTADRSISTIDTALRRRFEFVEMQPDADVLKGISVEGLDIKEMLLRMNKKITALYDREHTIGHSYFIPLRNNPSVETLSEIFKRNILPLLQEYFYEDYEKIRLILGDNRKTDRAAQFIVVDDEDYTKLFGDTDYDFEDTRAYSVNSSAFDNIEAYKFI